MKLDILQENTLLERFFVKLFRPTLLFLHFQRIAATFYLSS
jgi:hypothetical protein